MFLSLEKHHAIFSYMRRETEEEVLSPFLASL